MEFKWSVNKVTVAEDNLVVQVDLIVTATNGKNTASAAYTHNLVRGDLFIPYDQLTEDQVFAWCFPTVKDEGEAQVSGQIARQLAQKAVEPVLPWVTT
tara:strand:+ start:97 stop:390 length:294 start_codon:yes stop_codon:yes gene_type:complete